MLKICGKCNTEKSESDFNLRRGTLHQAYCKGCQAVYHRSHYLANKADYFHKSQQSRKDLKQRLNQLKARACTDCGVQYPPWVMDFDHPEGVEKVGNVSKLLTDSGFSKALAEAMKCEVVCSNCHRERTHQRMLRSSTG
jgi:hypothetical protein